MITKPFLYPEKIKETFANDFCETQLKVFLKELLKNDKDSFNISSSDLSVPFYDTPRLSGYIMKILKSLGGDVQYKGIDMIVGAQNKTIIIKVDSQSNFENTPNVKYLCWRNSHIPINSFCLEIHKTFSKKALQTWGHIDVEKGWIKKTSQFEDRAIFVLFLLNNDQLVFRDVSSYIKKWFMCSLSCKLV